MLKVTNKYILVGLVSLAVGLILWPLAGMHIFTTFAWWQILVFYMISNIPALIGLLVLVNVWGTFEIKEVTKK
ncbi:MAG: hypothetical protein V4682_00295 [Patescibacteria group bacterium]